MPSETFVFLPRRPAQTFSHNRRRLSQSPPSSGAEATAIAIAILWSPLVFILPPVSFLPPCITSPSCNSSTPAPRVNKFSAIAASLSHSPSCGAVRRRKSASSVCRGGNCQNGDDVRNLRSVDLRPAQIPPSHSDPAVLCFDPAPIRFEIARISLSPCALFSSSPSSSHVRQ